MTLFSAQLKLDVTSPADGGIELGAWLFLSGGDGIRPAITMAHGFGGTREHGLERSAQAFAAAGFVVLVHGVPTLVITYFFKSLFEIIRGDAGTARRGAEIAVKLSRENGLTLFAALGALQAAWVSARLDGRETGATELRQALAAFADQGNKLFVVVGLATIVTDDFRKLKSQCGRLVSLAGLSRSRELAPQQRRRLL